MRTGWSATCILLLGLAAHPGHAGMDPSKEYVYMYKGTVRIQNKEMPQQSTGYAFTSKFTANTADNNIYAKILEYKIDVINKDDIDWKTHTFDYKDNPAMTEQLTKPFHVMGPTHLPVKFQKDDKVWSVNMKKALASMFQLNVDKKLGDVYKVMEHTPIGDVETFYTITREPHFSNPNAKVMNVTKLRNYENADNIAHALYGSLRSTPCERCESLRTHPISLNMRLVHHMRLDDDEDVNKRITEHIHMESDAIHAPHRENGKVTRVYIEADICLMDERPLETKFDLSGETVEHKDKRLVFENDPKEFFKDVDLKEPNSFIKHWELKFDMDETKKLFEKVMNFNHEEKHTDDPKNDPSTTYMGIAQNVFSMSYDDLEKLYQDVVVSADDSKKPAAKRLFADVMTGAGTNPALKFAMDKFHSGELDMDDLPHFFKHVYLSMLQPSKKLLDTFYQFCKDEKTKAASGRAVGSCILAYTAMVAEACRAHETHPKLGIQNCDEMKMEAFKKVIPSYDEMKKRPSFHQIVSMKAAANLGTPMAADYLAKFIEDPEQPNRHRIQAIWSLSDIAPHFKTWSEHVRALMVRVYKDVNEPSDLRTAMFIAIINAHPPLPILRAIVDGLKDEPSDQVISHVSSTLYAIADAKHPCFRDLTNNVRYVVPLLKYNKRVKAPTLPTFNSHVHFSAGYDDKYDHGGYSYLSMIRSPNGYLPRSVKAGFGNYLAGFNYDTLGIHYEGWGLEKVIDMFRDPRKAGMKYGLNLWNHVGRKRRVRSAAEVKNVDDKIGIKQRPYEEMYARLSLSIFGHEMGVIAMNESSLGALMDSDKKLGSELKKQLEKTQEEQHYFMAKSMSFLMGTEIGLPVFIGVYQPGVFWRKRNQPEFNMDKASGDISLKMDSHIKYDTHMMEMFGFAVPGARKEMAAGFDRHIMINKPIKFSVTANLKTGKLLLTRPVIPDVKLFHYDFSPFTFVWDFDQLAPQMLPMYRKAELKEFDHRILDDKLGFGLHVTGHRLPGKVIAEDLRSVWADMDLRQKFYYFFINPKWHPRKVDVTLVTPEKDATTERQLELSYRRYKPEEEKASPLGANAFGTPEDPDMHVYVINAEATLKGTKERKMAAELRYAFDRMLHKHLVKLAFQRTPMGSDDTTGRSVCMAASAIIKKRDYSKVKEEREKFFLDDEIDINFDLAHNADPKVCTGSTEIKGVGKYEHSEEQLELIKDAIENWNKTDFHGNRMVHNPYKWLMRKAKMIEHDAGENNYWFGKFMLKSSQLNKFTMDVDMKNINIHKVPYIPTLYAHMKRFIMPYLTKYDPETTAEEGKLHCERNIREIGVGKWRADVTLKSPKYTAEYKGIPVPPLAHFAPKTAPVFGYTNLVTYNKYHYHAPCQLMKNMVHTFDKTEFKLPETDCFKVLAKDCSPHNIFTILAKKEGDSKHVKAYIDSHTIEIKPDGTVVFDGEEKKVDNGVVAAPTTPDGHEIVKVIRFAGMTKVKSYIFGVEIVAFEDIVSVQVAPFYRGKVCGLCGDYNLDRQHEFRDPKGCLHRTPYSFARTYAVPDGTCKVPGEGNPLIDGTADCNFNPLKP